MATSVAKRDDAPASNAAANESDKVFINSLIRSR